MTLDLATELTSWLRIYVEIHIATEKSVKILMLHYPRR